jgi:hypothetical protein
LLLLILLLRLVHIAGGAFWMGSIVLAVFFLEPTANAFGATGERVLAHVLFRARLMLALVVAATATLLAGAGLYWIDSAGLRIEWITSPTGMAFTVGGGAAVAAYAIALFVLKPHFDRLASRHLSNDHHDIDETELDAPPGEDRIRRWSIIQASLLVFAIAAMAIARYLP